ncbi:MAG: hypothetical protein ISS36_00035 [Candidatus Aenigmarchaeota archaeon]|nr:hypothetical protein [Candidatus Aenigmarchaeota archaeon]
MHKTILILTLVSVILVSGCVIPGTSIEIPGLPDIFGVQSEKSDVITIKSLNAYPSKITSSQEIRLIAYIENSGKETVGNLDVRGESGVTINLYDYCVGLFEIEDGDINCPSGSEKLNSDTEKGCWIPKFLALETKEVDWILKPREVELETPCDVKVSVTYPYETVSLTTIHFINENEYQRQLEEGSFKSRSSSIIQGEGPIKALLKVLDQQPIPTTRDIFASSLEVSNKGSGFVAVKDDGEKRDHMIFLESLKYDNSDEKDVCFKDIFEDNDYQIQLIQGRTSSKMTCELKQPTGVEKELTKTAEINIKYLYELRKEKKVSVTSPSLG